MFQNLCRSRRSTCRMPVSLSEWRVRIGTYVPRNVDPSEEQEMGSTTTTEHQSSTNMKPSKPEKLDSFCGDSDEQETPTATSDNTKSMPCKTSKKRKRHSQKGRDGCGRSAFLSFRCFMKSGASPLLRFLLLVFTTILLVRSGDVEMNPGPNETTVPDDTLLDIAKRIPQEKMYDLGVKLGVDLSALRNYRATNTIGGTVTSNGTLDMLVDWRDNTSMEQQEGLLKNALVSSSLQAVAEQYLPEGMPNMAPQMSLPGMSSHQNLQEPSISLSNTAPDVHQAYEFPAITDAQLEQCRKDIQAFYDINLCQIPTSPLDTDSLVELKCIFTNLVLLKEDRSTCTSTKKKNHLAYKELLDININKQTAKRIMIEGEAGVGKTTFCAKIASDWIEGEFYHEYDLVAVIPLREAKNGKTVGQVLKTYLSDDNSVTPEQLDEYIRTNQDKVLIIFDGLDEFGVEMSNGENQIVQILKGEKHKFGTVIVTTRPWKVHEIANKMSLRKQYAFVSIEGFKEKDVKTYIKKFYQDDETSAESLFDFMEEGSLIADTMAPFPIFCSMLCHMWKEVERRDLICKLQTFSQLFQEMIVLLKRHYVSKRTEEVDGNLVEMIGEKINGHFKKISEVAFNGLLDKQLVFPEERFDSCVEDLRVACEVGLLTKDLKRTKHKRNESVRKLAKLESTVSFPHKLFQEYTAGLYLQDLYQSNNYKFNLLMANHILENAGEFKDLLYFVGSFDEDIAKYVVTELMDQRKRTIPVNLIVEIAFECHSEKAANLVEAKYPELNHELTINFLLSRHEIAGYIFTFKHLVSLYVEDFHDSKALCRIIADTVCSLETLKELKIKRCGFYEEFIKSMQDRAEAVMVESLDIDADGLSESASQILGASICAMPYLKDVKLHVTGNLSDGFYSALREGASSLKVESLDIAVDGMSESATQILGASICAMPYLKDVKLYVLGNLSDGFYSALREGASSLKVESLDIAADGMSESASQILGASICAMPCLKNVKLSWNLSDGFYSALREGASSLNVESLKLYVNDISVHGSQSLGASICSMPCLRSVNVLSSRHRAESKITLRKDVGRSSSSSSSEVISSSCQINIRMDGELLIAFVSSLASSQTPCVQVESLELKEVNIGVHALQSLCASICIMPCLRSVNILCLSLSHRAEAKITLRKDVGGSSSSEVISSSCQINLKLKGELLIAFVSSLASSQMPYIQVESLQIHIPTHGWDIGESASSILGASICAMPCLKDVKLSGQFSDGFYSALREGASSLKVESLELNVVDIGVHASQSLCASICSMPCLRSVNILSQNNYDGARAKITLRKDVGGSSSSEVISSSCQINLNLEGKLIMAFVSSLSSSQMPSVQIKQMHLMGATLDSRRLSTIALMPTLKSLTLFEIKINDRNHTEEEGRDPSYTHASASLTELNADHDSFISLHRIGLLKRFPCIQKMTLAFHGKQTPFRKQLSHHVTLPDVTDLSLHGYYYLKSRQILRPQLATLSLEPFPNLINLSLINIEIGNANFTTILDSLKNIDTLKTISIMDCNTNARLDPLVDEINAEGKMMVTLEHGTYHRLYLDGIFKKL